MNSSNQAPVLVFYIAVPSYDLEYDVMTGFYIKNGSFLLRFCTTVLHHLKESLYIKYYRALLHQM